MPHRRETPDFDRGTHDRHRLSPGVASARRVPAQFRRHLRRRAGRQEPAHGAGLRDALPRDRCPGRDHACDAARPPRVGGPGRDDRRRAADRRPSRSSAGWRSSCSRRGRCAATGSTTTRPAEPTRPTRSVILAVGTAFFLAELGDKTMLATITLATREEALGTWLGSTAGMIAADAIAIAIGRWLGTRLPEQAIRYLAAGAVRAVRHRAHRRGTGLVHDRPVNRGGPLRLPHITRGRRR